MARKSEASASLVDLYLRLSIDKEGSDSLDIQEQDLRSWTEREGLTVRRVWRDPGKSGYKRNVKRPDFDAAVAAVKAGEVGTLAVWKLDRLSRQGAGKVGTMLDDLAAVGGRLYFLKDNLDSSVENNRLLIVLVSEQARAESANTSLRVRSKKAKSRAEGRYLGGSRPFGYVVGNGGYPAKEIPALLPDAPADGKLRRHPTEAPLARELVERLLAGESMLDVCRDWNARGVPTRRHGSEWRPSTISNFVRSPTLAGLVPAKRRDESAEGPGRYATVDAAWTDVDGNPVSLMADGEAPIVTEAERRRLLDMLDGRLRDYGRGRRPVAQPRSLLGGLIRCAWCQRPANTFGNSYRCRRVHASGPECAHPLVVSVAAIEAAVRRAWAYGLAALEPDDPILSAVADHWLAQYDPAPIAEREEARASLDEARARLADADDAHYVKGTLDAERYARVSGGLADRIRGIEARLTVLPSPEADLGALLDPELSLPAIQDATVEDARVLLRLAIQRVEVAAAPGPGVRFDSHARMRIMWVGETEEAYTLRAAPLREALAALPPRPPRKTREVARPFGRNAASA
jgi:site-specific DNA recombinase